LLNLSIQNDHTTARLGKASVTCVCCNGETKKAGSFKNRNGSVQRFQCLKCGKTFAESRQLAGVRTDTAKTIQVVKMLCEGLGIRSTSRLTGLEKKTVLHILETVGEHCANFMEEKLRNLKSEPIEVDECWSFVANKRGKGNTSETGDFYAFLASGKRTKLIASYITGKRKNSDGAELISDLRKRIANRFQITSDGWQGFIRGVLDYGRGKMDYAVQIKKYDGYSGNFKGKDSFDMRRRYSPGKCVAIKTLYITENAKRKDICTSHAERLNLSLRHFNKRFTRLSPCFSKKLANLEHSVALTVAHYNFAKSIGRWPSNPSGQK
jgi:transposase-like protein/IS1 family transposase